MIKSKLVTIALTGLFAIAPVAMFAANAKREPTTQTTTESLKANKTNGYLSHHHRRHHHRHHHKHTKQGARAKSLSKLSY
jgi:hypothetical protein